MEENTNKQSAASAETKGAVMENHNLIILDRSGSMASVRTYAVDAVNETLTTIKARQEANAADEKSYVTFIEFCGCGRKVIYDNVPAEKVAPISIRDYVPCCTTPLYDAIGNGVARLSANVGTKNNVSVQVTVITDGYENSSHEFSRVAIKSLIEAYKAKGWLFVYMGADHDVEKVAYDLSIDNHLEFEKSEDGLRQMSAEFNECANQYCALQKAAFVKRSKKLISDEEYDDEVQKLNNNFFNF